MSDNMETQSSDLTVNDHGVIPLVGSSQNKLVFLCLLAVYLIWGSTYLAIRLAVRDIPPLMMAGLRFLVAGAALYAFLRFRGAPALNRRQWLAASTAGTLMLGFGNGGLSLAEKTVSSG